MSLVFLFWTPEQAQRGHFPYNKMKNFICTIIYITIQSIFIIAYAEIQAETETTTNSNLTTEGTTAGKQFWCPQGLLPRTDGYYCVQLTKPWHELSSCVTIKIDNRLDKKCRNFTQEFLSCGKVTLEPHSFGVEKYGNNIIHHNGSSYPLGQFFIDDNNAAIVCGTPVLITPCKLLSANLLDSAKVADNGSVVIKNLSLVLDDSHYFIKSSDGHSLESVCIPMSQQFTQCKVVIILFLGAEAWIQEDWTLLTDIGEIVPYNSYLHLEQTEEVAYCQQDQPEPSKIGHVNAAVFIISIIFLILTLVVHLLVPGLNTQNKYLVCHIMCLIIAFTALVVKQFAFPIGKELPNPVACTVTFAFFYIFMLAAFFWLNVMSFQLWRIFRRIGCSTQKTKTSSTAFILSCLYAFGIPVALCGLTFAINWTEWLRQNLNMNPIVHLMCGLNNGRSLWVLMYTPITIILVENMVFFGLTVYNLMKAGSGAKLVNKAVYKQLLNVTIKLFFVMGLCWIMEVISYAGGGHESNWYFTDIINALQGVFIFVVYICNRTTWKRLREKFFPATQTSPEKTSSTSGNSTQKKTSIELQKVSKVNEDN